jgi:threonine dehydratase
MPPGGVSLGDIERAARVLEGRLHRTPVFTSARASRLTGGEVFLKAELLQRTGSFKPRGILNKLASLSASQRARGVIAASSGNHAQALAACSRAQGIDCLVVMPRDASAQKVEATIAYGAVVDQACVTGAEAIERAERLAAETSRVLIPAYDDLDVIAGQGTVGLELLQQVPDLDLVVVPVSGGGLIAGVAVAVKALRPQARVIAVEPELAPRLELALEAGRPVHVEASTLADGLGAPAIGERCLPLCQRFVDEVVQVSDADIVRGMRWIYANAKLACELAGAAALAALLSPTIEVPAGARVAVVVSGGNIELATVAGLLAE